MSRFNPVERLRYRSKLHAAYNDVFSSPSGKMVLRHLMRTGHVTVPVATPDHDQSLRNAGAQHLVLSILRFLKKRPDQIAEQIENTIESEYDA